MNQRSSCLRSQKEKAIEFRKMHQSGDILVLPNAWDVPSARIFEQAGFPAIGTSSAAIAISLGYPDGQKITRDEMLEVVERIARSVSIFVTADMEAGYGITAADVAETAERVIAAGAIGLNLEDSTKRLDPPLYNVGAQVRKIAEIKKVGDWLDVPLVINARTDVLILGQGDKSSRLKEAIDRGKAYNNAGADCFFPVGAIDSQTISEITRKLVARSTSWPPMVYLRFLSSRVWESDGSAWGADLHGQPLAWLGRSLTSFAKAVPT